MSVLIQRFALVALCLALSFGDDGKDHFHRRDLVFQHYIDDTDLSPDGTRFAIALEEKVNDGEHRSRLELWDFSAGKLAEKTFLAPWRGLPQVQLHFSGDGQSLLFYDGNGALHVLDERLSEVRQFEVGLASSDVRQLNELAAKTHPHRLEPLPVRPVVVEEMAVAPAGSLVAVRFLAREFSQIVHIFDWKSGKLTHAWGQPAIHAGQGELMTWDPSGQRLALGFTSQMTYEGKPRDILIYDTRSSAVVGSLRSGLGGVASVAFVGVDELVVAPAGIPPGKIPALHTISLSGQQSLTFSVPETGLRAPLAATPDGRILAALATRLGDVPDDPTLLRAVDTRFVIWNVSDPEPKAITPDLWPVKFPRVAISADGRRLLVARHYDSRRVVLLELRRK